MKWYDEPMVISAVQCSFSDTDSFEILDKHTAKSFNTEQLLHTHADAFTALYDEEQHGEKLRAYLKESRKKGIREIIYYNIHCVRIGLAEKHPEWLMRKPDGSPKLAYETQPAVCLNSSYTAEVVKQLKNLCRNDIDGIFLDGPICTGICCCTDCVKLFREKYGKDICTASDAELMRFNTEKVNAFMKKCHDAVKSIDPEIILYINNSALRADITGSNTRELYEYVDFLGAEGGFVWVNRNTSHWHVSSMAKMIETQAQGKPCVTFIAGDSKPWSFCMHTAEETKLYYAQAIANGSNVWYGIHGPITQMDTPGGKMAVEMNNFILNHKEIYTNHKPVTRIALMWSQNSANYYKSSVNTTDFTAGQTVGEGDNLKSDHYLAFMGCYEMLTRSHVQFDVVDEVSLVNGELAKYDLLIMPTAACMSDAAAEAVYAYVENGGNIISTYDTGFYNADGTRADKPKLADMQGIEAVEKLVYYTISGSGYMRASGSGKFMQNISWKLLPSCNYAAKVVPSNVASVFAETCVPMTGRYEEPPTEWFPALIERCYGKGRSLYFTGDIGEIFTAYSNPDHKRVFMNAVYDMAEPMVRTDAPGSVEIVLRKCAEGYALHVINFTGEMERPISRIIKLDNISVELSLGDVSDVSCITGAGVGCVEKTEKGIKFQLFDLNEYEVFIIK